MPDPTSIDDLPFGEPDTPPNLGAPGPRKCRHPREARITTPDGQSCSRCNHMIDAARARAGRRARKRGNAAEVKLAHTWGGRRTGHHGGPDDVVVGDLFTIQSKAGPSYWRMSLGRLLAALDALPRAGGRVPMLIVSNGKPGLHVRRLVVLDEADWRDLHGEVPK
jgi:hypothetical protein